MRSWLYREIFSMSDLVAPCWLSLYPSFQHSVLSFHLPMFCPITRLKAVSLLTNESTINTDMELRVMGMVVVVVLCKVLRS